MNHVSECIYVIRKVLNPFRPVGANSGSLLLLLQEPTPGALLNPVQVFTAYSAKSSKRCYVLRLFF